MPEHVLSLILVVVHRFRELGLSKLPIERALSVVEAVLSPNSDRHLLRIRPHHGNQVTSFWALETTFRQLVASARTRISHANEKPSGSTATTFALSEVVGFQLQLAVVVTGEIHNRLSVILKQRLGSHCDGAVTLRVEANRLLFRKGLLSALGSVVKALHTGIIEHPVHLPSDLTVVHVA